MKNNIQRKIRYTVKRVGIKVLFKMGFFKKLTSPKHPVTRILVFHGIDFKGQTHYNSRFVSAAYLEKLLSELKKSYSFISLDALYQNNYDAQRNNLVLTFDDGLQNNLDVALPILEKLNLPATFFITSCSLHHEVLWPDFLDLVTHYTNKTTLTFNGITYTKKDTQEFQHQGKTLKARCKELPFSTLQELFSIFEEEWLQIKNQNLEVYWKLMSLQNVKKMIQNPLVSIGAHSVYHPNLAAISTKEALFELETCKKELEAVLEIPLHQFAFPFGTYSQELITLAKNVGFTQLLALNFNQTSDDQIIELKDRFMINPHISWKEQLYFIKKGTY